MTPVEGEGSSGPRHRRGGTGPRGGRGDRGRDPRRDAAGDPDHLADEWPGDPDWPGADHDRPHASDQPHADWSYPAQDQPRYRDSGRPYAEPDHSYPGGDRSYPNPAGRHLDERYLNHDQRYFPPDDRYPGPSGQPGNPDDEFGGRDDGYRHRDDPYADVDGQYVERARRAAYPERRFADHDPAGPYGTPQTGDDRWADPRDGTAPRSIPPPGAARGPAPEATRKLPASSRTPPPPPSVPPPSEGSPGSAARGRAQPAPLVDGTRTTRLPMPPSPPRPVDPTPGPRPQDRPGWPAGPGTTGPDSDRNGAQDQQPDNTDRSRRFAGERRRPSLGESRPTVALPRSNVRRIPPESRQPSRGRDTNLPPDARDARRSGSRLGAGRDGAAGGWRDDPEADPRAVSDVGDGRGPGDGSGLRGGSDFRDGSDLRDVRAARPRQPPPRHETAERNGRRDSATRRTPRPADAAATTALAKPAAAKPTTATPTTATPTTATPTTARRGKAGAGKPGPSLGQASGIMAIGTIASRASGFLRTVAIAAALGTSGVSQAYNVANTTPNVLYDLLLGGILTSVIVPVMVRAAKEDPDGGDSFASSLLTIMILGLSAAVAVGMVVAPWITDAYLHSGPAERALGTEMLRWFLPQIIFYGVGATIGAILNVRQSFAAPMFAPILNNLLVIATCVAFVYIVSGPHPPGVDGPKAISNAQITVLAGGTTLGVVAMTLALLPSLRKVGFRYRPRLDLRHPELRSAARLAGWTLLFVIVSQVGYLVIVNLSTATTAYTIYTYGYQIFQLPYAIIGVSVITALLPRMSGHAAQGRRDLVRADISTATRVAVTAIVPAALFILALGRPIAVAVFYHGAVRYHAAVDIGDTLSAFALALVPFSLFQVQLRAFYAYQDSRTPALANMGVVAVNVLGAVVLTVLVPEQHRAPALALAFAFAYLVGLAATTILLRRRLGGVDGNRTARVITQVAVAAGLGAVIASLLARGIRSVIGTGWLSSGVAVVIATVVGGALFVAVAKRMSIYEVNALIEVVNSRLGGRLRRGRGRGGPGGPASPPAPTGRTRQTGRTTRREPSSRTTRAATPPRREGPDDRPGPAAGTRRTGRPPRRR
ncbi:murein biosynthesis integral membrane protein MurJ [Frankia gtarii]|uniref:murein biosynthesis integral membrane protein MurJ n=1 Tax=Frankia gtarii TaxID=2950102 RepID=UPI0021C0D556|nr:murein biosynthesis integral membrane protein MurJ [Frankia gtarii]